MPSRVAVTPYFIVEHFDVIENFSPGFVTRLVDLPSNPLLLHAWLPETPSPVPSVAMA